MKRWFCEIALCTIIAAVVALLFYVIGVDRSWADTGQTYIMAFLVMMAMAVYKQIKSKNKIE